MPEDKNSKGILVAIEGISGAGKTEFSIALEQGGRALGHDVLLLGGFVVRPYSSPLTAFIRNLVTTNRFIDFPWLAETHLIIAEMLYDIHALVRPAIASGKVVIYDSYIDSLIAFQTARLLLQDLVNTNLPPDYASRLMKTLLDSGHVPTADCTIYLKCAFSKAKARLEVRDRMPVSPTDFDLLEEIARQYDLLYSGKQTLILDSTEDKTSPELVRQALEYIQSTIKRLSEASLAT